MAYQVLARKWRPQTFDTMVGQEHVVRALTNALTSDRLHHAYLFTGTRGVGKTTVARVFAKCLNCETGVVGEPCGQCSACQEIAEGRFVDLIEIDAASRTRVEDMRELLDNVQYRPTRARFKVYLIDEVHMLSNSSFNALLKTLEEPPEHVKFLLATTDPQKLPVTVLSRCLQFNLKQLSPERIRHYLADILQREGIEAEEGALRELARAAQGSMRDALSLTDQAISFGDGALKTPDVADMLGTVDRQQVWALLESLLAEDRSAVMERVRAMADFSPDYEDVLQALAEALYAVALQQAVPGAESQADVDEERIQQLAGQQSPAAIQLLYQIALLARRDLGLSPDPQIGFEMALLRMLAMQPAAGGLPLAGKSPQPTQARAQETPQTAAPDLNREHAEPETRSVAAESPPEQSFAAQGPSNSPLSAEPPLASPAVEPVPDAPSVGEQSPDLIEAPSESEPEPDAAPKIPEAVLPEVSEADIAWDRLLNDLGATGILRAILLNTQCLSMRPENFVLRVDVTQQGIMNTGHPDKVKKLLGEHFSQSVSLDMAIGEIEGHSPAQLAALRRAQALARAEQAIQDDPNVEWLKAQFQGQIIENSTRPAEAATGETV